MVAGDAVNTAARVQSAAAPGTVLVDTTTRRLAGLAIEFDAQATSRSRARRSPRPCGGPARSSRASAAPSAPTGWRLPSSAGGRVRLLKDRLHATSRTGSRTSRSSPAPRASASPGWAGSSRSTSTDSPTTSTGTAAVPPFGEDTAYWALTEIVRARLSVGDDDDRGAIEAKLSAFLADLFDERARPRVRGARMAPLLGLATTGAELARSDLFAGWRRFFEGLARRQPVLLLVEDLHDADEGLLDFLEHLVDWVRDLPVLVIGFARPELVTNGPAWGPAAIGPSSASPRWSRGDARAARGSRRPHPAGGGRGDRGAGPGHPAVRGRDRAVPDRPARGRRDGGRLLHQGRRRHPRGAGEPARPARGPARRPGRRGSLTGRRRRRHRGAVHRRDARRGLPHGRPAGAGGTGRARPPRRAPDQRRHAVTADRCLQLHARAAGQVAYQTLSHRDLKERHLRVAAISHPRPGTKATPWRR